MIRTGIVVAPRAALARIGWAVCLAALLGACGTHAPKSGPAEDGALSMQTAQSAEPQNGSRPVEVAPATPGEAPSANSESRERESGEGQQGQAPGEEELTDEEVMYRVFAAELLGSEGDLEGAVGEYLEAAMESDDPAIAMRATRVAFAAQAWQQASMAADRWALLDPENIAARESAALAMLATADYASAEIQLREVLRLSKDKQAAWSMVSGLLARSASPEKAMDVLDNLLASEGVEGSAAGLHAQSQLAVRAGNVAQAYSLSQQAVEVDPVNADYLTWAARLALSQGNAEEGIGYMRRAWELNPDDHDLTLAYADMLARQGNEDEARQLLAQMIQTPDVMLTRILFELSAKDQAAANSLYSKFGEMEFEDAQTKAFFQAQSAEALNLDRDAIEYYSQITGGQYFLQAASRRAELLAQAGDIEGARSSLATLRLQSDPAIVEQSWMTEARIVQLSGDTEGALEILDEALKQFQTSIPVRYAHALVAAELRRVDVAETDLRVILAEQPEHAAALNALGYTLADQTDRYEEAEELIRRAFALQPDDASIIDSMGWIAYRLGRLQEAEGHLRRAWALDNNPEIAAHLGEVLWHQDKHEEAREVWRQAEAVDPNNGPLIETMRRLDSQP